MFCRKHDILKELMEKHAKEIMSMLTAEWDWDIAKRVWQDEARKEGEEIGIKKEKLIIAKNLLEKGSSPEFVYEITGISLDEIEKLMN